jgi:hypothetical protein
MDFSEKRLKYEMKVIEAVLSHFHLAENCQHGEEKNS